MQTFRGDDLSFQYPEGWHVAGLSTTNSPRRLAVTSYAVPSNSVEGDCGGLEAVRLLPPEGALVLVIDYGERNSFPARPESLTVGVGEFAEYECFGASTMFRFRVGTRDIQAHIALGSKAEHEALNRALAILSALTVDKGRQAS